MRESPNDRTTSPVSSVEPPFEMTISKSPKLCASTLRTANGKRGARLNVGITTEKKGLVIRKLESKRRSILHVTDHSLSVAILSEVVLTKPIQTKDQDLVLLSMTSLYKSKILLAWVVKS